VIKLFKGGQKQVLPVIRENVRESYDKALIAQMDELTQINQATPSFSRMGINMSTFDIQINSRDR